MNTDPPRSIGSSVRRAPLAMGELPAFSRARVAIQTAGEIHRPSRNLLSRALSTQTSRRSLATRKADWLDAKVKEAVAAQWSPAEVNELANAALQERLQLLQDKGASLAWRAAQGLKCVDNHDRWQGQVGFQPTQGLMAGIAQATSRAYYEHATSRPGVNDWLAFARAEEMNQRAQEFGAPPPDGYDPDWGMLHEDLRGFRWVTPEVPREEALTLREFEAIMQGRPAWRVPVLTQPVSHPDLVVQGLGQASFPVADHPAEAVELAGSVVEAMVARMKKIQYSGHWALLVEGQRAQNSSAGVLYWDLWRHIKGGLPLTDAQRQIVWKRAFVALLEGAATHPGSFCGEAAGRMRSEIHITDAEVDVLRQEVHARLQAARGELIEEQAGFPADLANIAQGYAGSVLVFDADASERDPPNFDRFRTDVHEGIENLRRDGKRDSSSMGYWVNRIEVLEANPGPGSKDLLMQIERALVAHANSVPSRMPLLKWALLPLYFPEAARQQGIDVEMALRVAAIAAFVGGTLRVSSPEAFYKGWSQVLSRIRKLPDSPVRHRLCIELVGRLNVAARSHPEMNVWFEKAFAELPPGFAHLMHDQEHEHWPDELQWAIETELHRTYSSPPTLADLLVYVPIERFPLTNGAATTGRPSWPW